MPPEFWAEEIKRLRDDPPARLELALADRPYPAAYREAAIALRALIRQAQKDGGATNDLLSQLYELGMEHAFLHDREFMEELGVSFDVAERFAREELDLLAFRYAEFGHERAALFTKTDRKWFEDAWGSPEGNRSPTEAYEDRWRKHAEEVKTENEAHLEELQRLMSAAKTETPSPKDSTGCLIAFAAPILFALAAVYTVQLAS